MFVELIGLSGSGKTTLYKKLIQSNEFLDIKSAAYVGILQTKTGLFFLKFVPLPVARFLGFPKLITPFFTRNNRVGAQSYPQFIEYTEKLLNDLLLSQEMISYYDKRVRYLLNLHFFALKNNVQKPILVDEYFSQLLIAILSKSNSPSNKLEEIILNYKDVVLDTHLIMYVETNPEECARRSLKKDNLEYEELLIKKKSTIQKFEIYINIVNNEVFRVDPKSHDIRVIKSLLLERLNG